MPIESTADQAPDFGPAFPVYPELPQILRVTGGPAAGNVYTAFVQQYNPSAPLTFRDREACYLTEPNGVILVPGYYDGRLVGSYLTLPLFAVTCCPT